MINHITIHFIRDKTLAIENLLRIGLTSKRKQVAGEVGRGNLPVLIPKCRLCGICRLHSRHSERSDDIWAFRIGALSEEDIIAARSVAGDKFQTR
jgi:hypothetical protein